MCHTKKTTRWKAVGSWFAVVHFLYVLTQRCLVGKERAAFLAFFSSFVVDTNVARQIPSREKGFVAPGALKVAFFACLRLEVIGTEVFLILHSEISPAQGLFTFISLSLVVFRLGAFSLFPQLARGIGGRYSIRSYSLYDNFNFEFNCKRKEPSLNSSTTPFIVQP